MSEKIDIFKVLTKINEFDVEFFESLTEDEKKGIPPYTLMLWLNSCKSEVQVRQVNAFLNSTVFEIPAVHRDLLYKLACISSDGKKNRYIWIKKPTATKKYATTVDILTRYYHCSKATALGYVSLLDADDVIELASELGEQEDILKKIRKEFK